MLLYIHFPFCMHKCAYCDFLSFPADAGTRQRYLEALIRELQAVSVSCGQQTVTSIFLGGGTPSVMEEGQIAAVMHEIRRRFCLAQDCEVTVESNPGTLTVKKLAEYRASGVNRLSIGCQSARDEELRALGRIHSFADFEESYALARTAGFTNINVDLMSGLPGQHFSDWEGTLRTVAGMQPTHISAYSLILEEGTPFYEREDLALPDEEEERLMYEETAGILQSYGYHQYEISNYAKPGYECRHNTGYWRRIPYLGLGLGAASYWGGCRFVNTDDLQRYLRESGTPDRIRIQQECLSRKEQMAEFMFLGLRMNAGISRREFQREFEMDLAGVYGTQIAKMEALGLLEEEGDTIRLTRRGISLSNQVFVEFI